MPPTTRSSSYNRVRFTSPNRRRALPSQRSIRNPGIQRNGRRAQTPTRVTDMRRAIYSSGEEPTIHQINFIIELALEKNISWASLMRTLAENPTREGFTEVISYISSLSVED